MEFVQFLKQLKKGKRLAKKIEKKVTQCPINARSTTQKGGGNEQCKRVQETVASDLPNEIKFYMKQSYNACV